VGPWGWIGWWLFDTDGWSSAYFIGDHGVFDGDEWWRKKNIGEAWGRTTADAWEVRWQDDDRHRGGARGGQLPTLV
jgi:hypothetical protein